MTRLLSDPLPGRILDRWIQGVEPEGLSLAEEGELEREKEEAEQFGEAVVAAVNRATFDFSEDGVRDMIESGVDIGELYGWSCELAEAVVEQFDRTRRVA
jgi:hypothetical protein